MGVYVWTEKQKESTSQKANSQLVPIRLVDISNASHIYLYVVDPVTGEQYNGQWLFAINRNDGTLNINKNIPEMWKNAIGSGEDGRLVMRDECDDLIKYEVAI